EERAAHRGVAARLVHQEAAQPVQVPDGVVAALGHGGAGDGRDAAGDDAGRHALGVRVDGGDGTDRAHQAARRRSAVIARSMSAVTAARSSAPSGPRGGRQGPPYRPTRSMPSLMAWTNSVRESQRNAATRGSYRARASSSLPAAPSS